MYIFPQHDWNYNTDFSMPILKHKTNYHVNKEEIML